MAALGWGLFALICILLLVFLWLADLVNAVKKRDEYLVLYHIGQAIAVVLFVGTIVGMVILAKKFF